ncbi:MAG: phosphoenolpyruvate carboxylase, partial [Pseudomonadota bacterium]
MPKRSRPSSALKSMPQLGAEIRELGRTLGRIITRLEGQATFETVERLRKLAKASRAGDVAADAELSRVVAGLSPREAFDQAMAFTLYFELV